MATREVRDCDMCGVKDIRRKPIRVIAKRGADPLALDLCAECGSIAFEFVAPAIDSEMVGSLMQMILDRRAKGEFEPL